MNSIETLIGVERTPIIGTRLSFLKFENIQLYLNYLYEQNGIRYNYFITRENYLVLFCN